MGVWDVISRDYGKWINQIAISDPFCFYQGMDGDTTAVESTIRKQMSDVNFVLHVKVNKQTGKYFRVRRELTNSSIKSMPRIRDSHE